MLPIRKPPKDAKGPELVPIRKAQKETDREEALVIGKAIRNLYSHVGKLIVECDYNNDKRDQSSEKR